MDWSEAILDLVGWMVAGGVTLVGILIAYWLRDWRDEQKKDLSGIYEPTHNVIMAILNTEDSRLQRPEAPHLYDLEGELRPIVNSTIMVNDRMKHLKDDLESLIFLSKRLDAAESGLYDRTLQGIRSRITALTSDPATKNSLGDFLVMALEDQLIPPILKGDVDELHSRIKGVSESKRVQGDKSLFEREAERLYFEVSRETANEKESWKKEFTEYFDKVRGVRAELEQCIRKKGKTYRKSVSRPRKPSPPQTGQAKVNYSIDDQQIRLLVLQHMKTLHDSDPLNFDQGQAISRELSIDMNSIIVASKYLSELGLIRIESWMMGPNFLAQITSGGIDYLSKSLEKERQGKR